MPYQDKTTATKTTGIEDKAAKIERLKSGFRICKPQGTFLWPSTTTSPPSELVLRLHDLLLVPTPPSVSSSTTSPPLLPTSPVKPLAEKRPVTLAALPTTTPPIHPLSVPMTSPRSLINLNEIPTNQTIGDGSGLCSGISNDNTDSLPSNSSAALTYRRRQHSSVLTPFNSASIPAVCMSYPSPPISPSFSNSNNEALKHSYMIVPSLLYDQHLQLPAPSQGPGGALEINPIGGSIMQGEQS